MSRGGGDGAIYSTQHGSMCPECGNPIARCRCRAVTRGPQDGIVRVSRETKGRKGKGVTLVTGAPIAENDLPALCKELKRRCGSGGTVKDGVIEIQGDHRDVVVGLLEKRGWIVRRSGG